MSNKGRGFLFSTAILIVILSVFLMVIGALPSLRKPLIMDEMEFPAVAQAIKYTGSPIYYRGETNSHNVGLWHPPLYIVTLAAWQVIFGSSVISNRVYGLFNACLALVLIGLFVIQRWDWRGGLWKQNLALLPTLLISIAIASTAPLYIQGSILPDIDTQVLPLLITMFFLLLFELRRRVTARTYWGVFVLALAVQFFAKLTTPVLLVPAFMMSEFIHSLAGPRPGLRVRSSPRQQAKGAPNAYVDRYRFLIPFNRAWMGALATAFLPILAGAVSLILMIGTWFLIARVWGVSFSLPFTYLTQSSNNPASLGSSTPAILAAIIEGMPGHFRYFAQWVGYPILLLLILMILREFLHATDGILYVWERAALYTFLILLICMYIVLKPAPFDFPKYYPALMPLLTLLVVDLLVALHKEKRLILTGIALVLEIVMYLLYIGMSSTLKSQDFIYQIYYSSPNLPIFISWVFAPLAIVMIVNGIIWLFAKRKFGAPFIVAAITLIIGWQIATMARQMVVPYSTTYLYGEQSLSQTVAYLRTSLPDKTILIAPKDVGFMLEDHWRYIELDVDPRLYFSSPGVDYLVFRSNDYYGHTIHDTPKVYTAVQQQFKVIATIDNFVVMKRSIPASK
jgi:hypothetical protein